MSLQIDKKNVLLIGTVIFLITAAGIYEFNNQLRLNKPEKAFQPQVVNNSLKKSVAFTGQDFVPQTITVEPGTLVTFTNKSDSPMWVASDPHPAHTGLSSFDQQEVLYKNGVYQYVFNSPGIWKYHNHVIPSNRGTIIVKE